MKRHLKVLHITPMYPSKEKPSHGIFVKRQIESINSFVDNELLILPGKNGVLPYIYNIPLILKTIYRSRADLMHIHYGNVSSMIKLLYFGKKKIITSYCGDDLLGTFISNGKATLKSRFFRILNVFLSRYDKVSIVKSEVLAKEIQGISRKIKVLPNGVDIDLFQPMVTLEARQRLGLDTSKKVILFPADIKDNNKNFVLLNNALNELNNKNYQLITFENRRTKPEEIPLYLNASDLIVCTSITEGSPNVIKEAMSCNKRVFSTNCGDVLWLLENASGSKILSYDKEDWVVELNKFLEEEEKDNFSNSREILIQKKLDNRSIAQKLVAIYEESLNK